MLDDLMRLGGKVIDPVKRKVYGRTFHCPVCHLELAVADIDDNGLVVCPLCGVVIHLEEPYGHAVPVVNDVEIYRVQPRTRIHPLATHFPIGLFPLAVLGAVTLIGVSVATALWGNGGDWIGALIARAPVMADATLLLLAASVALSTVTLVSGWWDWRHRYRGRPYRHVTVKIAGSIVFLVLGAIAVVLHASGAVFSSAGLIDLASPANLGAAAVYLAVVSVNMIVLVTLGHVGGQLVFGK